MHIRFSCPYTSQQNRKYECMLCTINNVIHTLFSRTNMPPTYCVNILPSTTLKNDNPHHKLFQQKPSYTYLRVFGCFCNRHILTPNKLAPPTTPFIFLGYPSNHRGFLCLNLSTMQIIISHHVVFDETVFPLGSMTLNKTSTYSFLDTSDHTQ